METICKEWEKTLLRCVPGGQLQEASSRSDCHQGLATKTLNPLFKEMQKGFILFKGFTLIKGFYIVIVILSLRATIILYYSYNHALLNSL